MSTSPRAKPLAPQHRVYSNFDQVKEDLHALFAGMQQKNYRITATAPIAATIGEGELVLFDDATNRRIYTKINGTIRYASLT